MKGTKGTRYKKGGWYGESYRHYLAAKGIPTGRKYMACGKDHDDYMALQARIDQAQEPSYYEPSEGVSDDQAQDYYEPLEDPVEDSGFKFADALRAPGDVAKQAGTAFADLVRFSKSMDPEDMQRPTYARKGSLTPGVDPTVIDARDVPQGSILYVDEVTGDIVAYENDALGEAVAVVDEKLRAAEKRGIIKVDPGESIQARIKGADDIPVPAHNYESPVRIREFVTDIPAEIRQDMDFDTGFKLSDAATLPGALAKDAGGAVSDMVSFAKDVTSMDK